eukprot:TRINITY_DN739_c0_g3_i1.p1 TRINITY_DN739_c0_g3~~TRINITY_DN739_c0_g3_i1.p1  ORF type:complete len:422 (+),score=75.83 TRINITY_DN739_c0_g3_i1:58-1323(+)
MEEEKKIIMQQVEHNKPDEALLSQLKLYNSRAQTLEQLKAEEKSIWKFERGRKTRFTIPEPFPEFPRIPEENNKINADITESDYQAIFETLSENKRQLIISKQGLKKVEVLNLCYFYSELMEVLERAVDGYWVKRVDDEVSELQQTNELRAHFNYMKYYKTERCNNRLEHDKSQCFCYHSEAEARRPIQRISSGNSKGKTFWNYYPALCTGANCRNFSCKYAHTFNEINYHPLHYKTLLCEHKSEHDCKDSCVFVHSGLVNSNSEHVRNVKRLYGEFEPSPANFTRETYKTFRCFLSECNDPGCLGYHDTSEKRRKSKQYKMMCGKLLRNRTIGTTNDCSKGDKCKLCHTLNELKYHEEVYKTEECNSVACKLGPEKCSHIHNENLVLVSRMKLNVPEDYRMAIDLICSTQNKLQVTIHKR